MYTITNEKFSQSADKATAVQIIEMVIGNNQEWGTDYTEDDFEVTAERIKCQGEVIAEAVTTYKVTAVAPTSYQFSSMLSFGMPYRNQFGRFIAEQEFDTEEEAKEYLRKRAEIILEAEEIAEAFHDIEMYGMLTLDAVTATIVEQ